MNDPVTSRRVVAERLMLVCDDEERACYVEAQAKVPHLVETESDPALMLEFELGDADRAARRLAYYWKKRSDIYGERWLLPLHLSGEGALSENDLETLQSGYQVFLPDDSTGRLVLYFDTTRASNLENRDARNSRFRCLFYMLSVAAWQRKPLLFLRYGNSISSVDIQRVKNFSEVLRAVPVATEVHCIYVAPKGARRAFESTLTPLLEQLTDVGIRSCVASSPEELCSYLNTNGCQKESLPKSAGGTWSYRNFTKWLTARRHLARGVKDETQLEERAPYHVLKLASAADRPRILQARAERKRRNDIQYARQRRNQERERQGKLAAEAAALRQEQLKLRTEEKRLEELLAAAVAQVREQGGSVAPLPAPATVPHAAAELPTGLHARAVLKPAPKRANLKAPPLSTLPTDTPNVPPTAQPPALMLSSLLQSPHARLALLYPHTEPNTSASLLSLLHQQQQQEEKRQLAAPEGELLGRPAKMLRPSEELAQRELLLRHPQLLALLAQQQALTAPPALEVSLLAQVLQQRRQQQELWSLLSEPRAAAPTRDDSLQTLLMLLAMGENPR